MYCGTQSNRVGICIGTAAVGLRSFASDGLRNERGAAMAEYALLIALVALAVFAAIALFGGALLGLFTDAEAEFSTINGNTP